MKKVGLGTGRLILTHHPLKSSYPRYYFKHSRILSPRPVDNTASGLSVKPRKKLQMAVWNSSLAGQATTLMSTFLMHDGRNELGPFTIDELKKQKLTRNTPIRVQGTDKWSPAEKINGLREVVVPRKIRKIEDVVPAIKETYQDLRQRKPLALYGSFLAVAMLASVFILTKGDTSHRMSPQVVSAAQINTPLPSTVTEPAPVRPVADSLVATIQTATPVPKAIKEDPSRTARLHWTKLIKASNSNYGIGVLGGIKDLSVSVSNRSDYPVDEAVVNVTYLKANGKTIKNKLITLYGIAPGDSKEHAVPDYIRGKKVRVSLYKVVSKRMKLFYTSAEVLKEQEDAD
jgi:hypothetical protein